MSEAILPRPQGLNSRGVDVSLLLARRVVQHVFHSPDPGWKPSRTDRAPRRQAKNALHSPIFARLKTHVAARVPHPHARGMFVVIEAEAAAIRAAFDRGGEFLAAVELRRLFPGIADTAHARECARTTARLEVAAAASAQAAASPQAAAIASAQNTPVLAAKRMSTRAPPPTMAPNAPMQNASNKCLSRRSC